VIILPTHTRLTTVPQSKKKKPDKQPEGATANKIIAQVDIDGVSKEEASEYTEENTTDSVEVNDNDNGTTGGTIRANTKR